MATITSVGSGNWSTAGTWDSGVPVDGDDVVISAGHTVTFDADQSAFTTGVKITITGTLNHALTGGPYTMFLKTGASLVGAGTWNVGTEANPIPFAVKHTITGASDWYADGTSGLTITVYAAEPTTKYVKLSDTEAIGQTVLEVDTDVTGDIWAEGDTIHINNVNKGSQSESRTIAAGGIAAGAITVTAGLTAAKLAGSYVLLMSRNVKFIAVGNQKIFNAITGATIAGGEFVATKYLITSSATTTISGGTFRGATTAGGIYSCTDFTISGGVYSSNAYTIVAGSGHIISGGVYSGNANGVVYSFTGVTIEDGIFAGNFSVLSSVMAPTILYGTFYGNQYIISAVRGGIIYGGTYENNTSVIHESSVECDNIISTNNTQDIYRSLVAAYNCSFGGTTEFTGYDILPKETFSYSINHDQVAGAYKAWTKGGVTTKQAVTYPTGFTNSMQTVLESATSEGYWQKEISVGAGQSVNITSYLRKDSSMTYLPRVIMFLKNTTDPFAGGTGLHTFTMTDSVDTWEDDTYTYSNDTSEDVVLVIRTQGKNATGNLFSYLDIEVINVDLTSVIALLNTIDGKADTIDANVDAVLADTGTDGVKIASGELSTVATASSITALDGKIDTIDNFLDTEIAAILADTNELQAELADGGRTDLLIDAIKAKTDALDNSAVTFVTAVNGTTITVLRGDTLSGALTDVGALTDYVSIDFTVKERYADTDDDAIIRIRKNATGTSDGLLRLNKAAPTSALLGSITIDDLASGDITIALAASCTDDLSTGGYVYDVQLITATAVKTLTSGRLNVTSDVTRAIA